MMAHIFIGVHPNVMSPERILFYVSRDICYLCMYAKTKAGPVLPVFLDRQFHENLFGQAKISIKYFQF